MRILLSTGRNGFENIFQELNGRRALPGTLLLCLLLFCPLSFAGSIPPGRGSGSSPPVSTKAPAAVLERLAAAQPQDLIVLFDSGAVEAEAMELRRQKGLVHDDADILTHKAQRYREIKQPVLASLPKQDFEIKRDYSNLPMAFLHFRTEAALRMLLERPDVLAVFENRQFFTQLAQSLPLIGQPQAAAVGKTGSGTVIAVIDTGINYTLPAFGSCTAPGVPAGCKVIASVDLTGNGVTLNTDPYGHGTNVAGIAAGVAPGAGIAAINVFSNGATTTEWLTAGIDWAIANKSAYNIVAINMSLGDGSDYTSTCGSTHGPQANPFVTQITNARSAGILSVVASGNNGYTDGISMPACTPGVVSVGAVYDANVGGLQWTTGASTTCTDYTTAADKITCFSNSANYLTMLAPGALITAAGITMGGTSQATPHVAGAVAVMRASFPNDTLDQTVARLTGSGVALTDPRNGITKTRLNLLAAIGPPANDPFTAAVNLSGDSGTVAGENYNATKEAGEPAHAGNAGGASIWWHWTPSFSGRASIDTHGSGFNTLLAVYTGSQVANLIPVAANDNDGSAGGTSGLAFSTVAGTTYLIAVDGSGGATGPVTLNWSLVPQADLSLTMAASPTSVAAGDNLTYTLTVTNSGPSTATAFTITDTLPVNCQFVSASPGCTIAGGTVTCTGENLTAGNAAQFTIVITPQAAGTLENTAAITSGTTDPVTGNNTAIADIAVTDPPPAVPALSGWGILLVAGLLMTHVGRCSSRVRE